jgi:hypothetical protein
MTCKYCGKPAGFLRKKHKECEQKFLAEKQAAEAAEQARNLALRDGRQKITTAVWAALTQGAGHTPQEIFNLLEDTVTKIQANTLVPNEERNGLFIAGWEAAATDLIKQNRVDVSNEQLLAAFEKRFSLSAADLNKHGLYGRLCGNAPYYETFPTASYTRFQ